jgi:probable HAF family extracellular repeat protein
MLRRVHLALLALPLSAAACGDAPPTDPVPVPPAAVASVSVDPSLAEVVPGDSVQLRATLRDSLGRELRDRNVVWRSADTTVVTVSAGGMARVVRNQPRAVAVSAESEGRSGRAMIGVAKPPPGRLAWINVQPYAPSIALGATRRMRVYLLDESGAQLPDRPVKWSTSHPSVLAVSDSGVIRGVGPGTASLTAEVDGVRSSVSYEVDRGYSSVEMHEPARDLNDRGQVAGIARLPGGLAEVVVWDAGAIRHGPRAESIENVAISSRGDVAGTWRPRSADRRRGFVWVDGQVRTIAPPDSAADLYVTDINSAGTVVGFWTPCGSCAARRAFVWENGAFRDLGGLGGGAAEANGINDAGQVVATVYADSTPGSTSRVVVLQDGSRTDGAEGQARAINARGDVAGKGANHGAFIRVGGRLTVLEAGRHETVFAYGISAEGEALVSRHQGTGEGIGFVWRNGRMLMLSGLVADRDLSASLAGWVIGGGGQILAHGRDANGAPRTLLLTPLPR